MNSKRVPSDKLQCLVSAAHHVLQVLKQSHSGTPASADDFLPALIYCVLQANPPLLHSNISFITYFSQQRSLQSGEAGYFFTNLVNFLSIYFYIREANGQEQQKEVPLEKTTIM